MIKLMYIGDHGSSGFGVVAKGLLTGLHASGEYDILQLGINYNDVEPSGVPWKVIPAGFYYPTASNRFDAADPYGHYKLDKWLDYFDPDVVFINNDFPVGYDYMIHNGGKLSKLFTHRSVKILYAPMDSWPFPKFFREVCTLYDQVISYSYFQLDMMRQVDEKLINTPVVYHGVDMDTYYPIRKSEAKARVMDIFTKYNKDNNVPDLRDKFIVYFVGTNQWRKNLPALFRAFVEFNKKHEDVFLIPHTDALPMADHHGGWALFNLRDLTELKNAVIYQYANIFTPEEMNLFYNAADVLAYPTRGEGFGLPSIEAMATKTPVLATRFGPQYELHADGRGFFIDIDDLVPGNRSAITYYAEPSWQHLAEQLEYIYTHPDEADKVAETAYEWVKGHTWDSKAQQVDGIIKQCLLVSKRPYRSRSTRKPRPVPSNSVLSAVG